MSSILAVGSIAYDTVETPFGSREDVLAGSVTYFSVAASHFVPVAVVAAIGEDFREEDLGILKSRGIDVSGVERLPGRTFRWAARYSEDLNDRETLSTELGVFADFKPAIPEKHRKPPYLFLGNIDPGLQMQVCESVERPRLVACDTMNFWIEGRREALLRTLGAIDLLIINDEEARMLSGEANLIPAAKKIRALGPRSIVIKRGEYGAAIFTEGFTGLLPALLLEGVVDPTGAGDSFAGGMLGVLAALGTTDAPSLLLALAAGTVMASFTVQGFGMEGLLGATPGAIRRRHAELASLVGAVPRDLPLASG
jgi:sugar/nucleoside kinase (ribokinase family)